MRFVVLLSLALVFAFSVGCVRGPVSVAPSTMPIDGNYELVQSGVTGSHQFISIFGAIPLGKPDQQAAINDALGRAGGGANALINVRVWAEVLHVIFVSFHTVHVEGDAVRVE